jgi:hypothetical protein
MRPVAWLCVGAGILSAAASFLITANAPTVNPWPSLGAGFCLTALGIVLLAIQGSSRGQQSRGEPDSTGHDHTL